MSRRVYFLTVGDDWSVAISAALAHFEFKFKCT